MLHHVKSWHCPQTENVATGGGPQQILSTGLKTRPPSACGYLPASGYYAAAAVSASPPFALPLCVGAV
eukprot:COSAG01_NODE_175_length_22996_cov_18.857892_5_plen_68_part_00